MVTRHDQAVVVGASMGGLLAARVLADVYRDVVIVERDVLPTSPENRRGVPQGRQPHVLLARAAEILEELFPGILAELVDAGAPVWDDGDLSKLFLRFAGHQMVNTEAIPEPARLVNYYPSRAMVECAVRKRLLADHPRVSILQARDLVEYTATSQADAVTGVRIANRADGTVSMLPADLVIDASGRASRTPVLLEQLGYRRPREDELTVQITYASQVVHLPDAALRENLVGIMPDAAHSNGFFMFRAENDTWRIGVGAIAGNEPPKDRDGILAIADDIAPKRIAAAARVSEPVAEVAHYRVPSNRWRRYDTLSAWPDGLVVLGDAVCSFNPIYGQGMTVAAIESIILRDCLHQGDDDLAPRFFRSSARKVKVAWQTAVGSDLALPQIQGPRPLAIRASNAYIDWVLTAAEVDPAVAQQFLRVTGMLDSPATLLGPSFVARVRRSAARAVRDSRLARAPVTSSPTSPGLRTVSQHR